MLAIIGDIIHWIMLGIMWGFTAAIFILFGSVIWALLQWVWEFLVAIHEWIVWKRKMRQFNKVRSNYTDELAKSLQQPPDQIYVRK